MWSPLQRIQAKILGRFFYTLARSVNCLAHGAPLLNEYGCKQAQTYAFGTRLILQPVECPF